MKRSSLYTGILLSAISVAACGPERMLEDVQNPPNDATGSVDVRLADTGNADTGRLDTGNADTGRLDTGNADTGNADTGNADAGNMDAGNMDAGGMDVPADVPRVDVPSDQIDVVIPVDTGRPDAGQTDTGTVPTDTGPSSCPFPIRQTLAIPPNVGGSTTVSAPINMTPITSNFASFAMCPTATMNTSTGEDHVYQLDVTTPVTLDIAAWGTYAPLIALRTTCDDMASQLACNRLNAPMGSMSGSAFTVTLNPNTYYLIVDRVTTLTDTYNLSITRR